MIVTRTYASKANTIGDNDLKYTNLSLNPVMELNYGRMLTRGMIYFNHSKIKRMVEDKTYPDMSKLTHTLHMTNCSSIEPKELVKPCMDSRLENDKKRVGSFDLIFFLIPNDWDDGNGFDYVADLYTNGYRAYSSDACTWMKSKNYFPWEEEGIYTTEHLIKEFELYNDIRGNLSKIIFTHKHFEHGNEDLVLDVTDIFNRFITGELCNYGFGIAFAPDFELIKDRKMSSYVGFYTQHTQSFFEPYIETRYDETIEDDRTNFYLNKDNKLYFYSSINGNFDNLDEMPVCTIDGTEYEVKQATKGVYYAEITLTSDEHEADEQLFDVWSNIVYKGRKFNDVELSFVTKESDGYFAFGLPSENKENTKFEPSIYGIQQHQKIRRGDIRKVNIECRIPYTSNQLFAVDGIEYRLYAMSGQKEITVIDWTKAERGFNENFFLLNTDELIPYRYRIDIRVTRSMELTYYKNMVEFNVISDMIDDKK